MKDLFNEAEFKILSERMEEIIKEAEQIKEKVIIILTSIEISKLSLNLKQYRMIAEDLPMVKSHKLDENTIEVEVINKLGDPVSVNRTFVFKLNEKPFAGVIC